MQIWSFLITLFRNCNLSLSALPCRYHTVELYQFAGAAVTKYHRLGGLITEIHFLTVLEAGRKWSQCPQDWFILKSLSLALNGLCLPVSLLGLLSVHACVLISSYEDSSHTGVGFSLMPSFYLKYLFKDPISKYNHVLRYGGGGHNPAHKNNLSICFYLFLSKFQDGKGYCLVCLLPSTQNSEKWLTHSGWLINIWNE